MSSSSKFPMGNASDASNEEGNFNPHVILVKQGEDISKLIVDIVKGSTRDVCILSSEGSITVAELESFGRKVKYEGMFFLLKMSGAFTSTLNSTKDGEAEKSGAVNVCLVSNTGTVFGGRIAGALIAGSPVSLVIASYIPQPLPYDVPVARKQRKPKRARANIVTPTPAPAAAPDNEIPVEVGEGLKGKVPINHFVTFVRGQDLIEAILHFANSISRNIVIMSAHGTISYVEIASPYACDNFKLRRKGKFEVVKLSAALIPNPASGDACEKIGGISVILSDSNGNLFGGEVSGPLVAGGAVDVVFMSFQRSDMSPNVEDTSDGTNELYNLAMACCTEKSCETDSETEDEDCDDFFKLVAKSFKAESSKVAQVRDGENYDHFFKRVITSSNGNSSKAARDDTEDDSEDDLVVRNYKRKCFGSSSVQLGVEDEEDDDERTDSDY